MSGRRSRAKREDDEPGMTLESGKLPDGTYQVVLSRGDEHWPIPREQINDYVAGVMAVASWADHDSAVLRQLVSIGLQPKEAAQAVFALRVTRRPPPGNTWPLELGGGVSSDGEFRPFVSIHLAGQPVGQWTVTEAQEHCVAVLGLLATVDLDDAYSDYLVQAVGIEPGRASNVVNDLQNFRTMK